MFCVNFFQCAQLLQYILCHQDLQAIKPTDKQTKIRHLDNFDSNKQSQVRTMPENYGLPQHATRFPALHQTPYNQPHSTYINLQHPTVDNHLFVPNHQHEMIYSQQFPGNPLNNP